MAFSRLGILNAILTYDRFIRMYLCRGASVL